MAICGHKTVDRQLSIDEPAEPVVAHRREVTSIQVLLHQFMAWGAHSRPHRPIMIALT